MAEAQAYAHKLMNDETFSQVLLGTKIYEKFGKGDKIIPTLVKNIERIAKTYKGDKNYFLYALNETENFIKRNAEKKKQSSLEGKLALFLLFTILSAH